MKEIKIQDFQVGEYYLIKSSLNHQTIEVLCTNKSETEVELLTKGQDFPKWFDIEHLQYYHTAVANDPVEEDEIGFKVGDKKK